jgi:hypothetical protein
MLLAGVTTTNAVHAAGKRGIMPPGAVGLDVSAHGDVVDVLIAYHDQGSYELRHRRSLDGGRSFGAEVTIPTGDRPPVGPHRGMDAQIASHGDQVVALWTIPGSSRFGTGPLATAISADGGRTWSAGPNPADDGSDDGHGFSDLAFDADGKLHAVWLDGRDGAQGLRWSRSDDFGRSWRVNETLDPVTCECCWNKVLPGPDGAAFVLYRDKEPRDMALVSTEDSGESWSERGPTESFEWDVDGCPHVGGGISLVDEPRGESLNVVSWTGKTSVAGLYLERSRDRGKTWEAPQRLAGPTAQHADLATGNGHQVAVWDEVDSGKRKVVASRSASGREWAEPTRLSGDGVNASHPLVVAVSDGFVVVWTETPEGAAAVWRSARLDAAAPVAGP